VLPAWPRSRPAARKAARSRGGGGQSRDTVSVAPGTPGAYRRAVGRACVVRLRPAAIDPCGGMGGRQAAIVVWLCRCRDGVEPAAHGDRRAAHGGHRGRPLGAGAPAPGGPPRGPRGGGPVGAGAAVSSSGGPGGPGRLKAVSDAASAAASATHQGASSGRVVIGRAAGRGGGRAPRGPGCCRSPPAVSVRPFGASVKAAVDQAGSDPAVTGPAGSGRLLPRLRCRLGKAPRAAAASGACWRW
jgi:hypothetical protein